MADYKIEAQPRTVTGKKVGALRRAGLVPITVYGPKTPAESLQVPYRPLEIALMKAGGTNLIDLAVEGGKTHVVLARDVQRDVLKGSIMHVDFVAVDLTHKIRADIPIHFIGESPVVESRQGILITGPSMLTVEVLPAHIMNFIEVDLSVLVEIGDTIHVSDLQLGDVTILNDPEELLAGVRQTSAARATLLESEEEDEGEVEEGAEPEVIARGKAEEDEE